MFKFEANKCYRMPAHFGGYVFDPAARAGVNDALSIQFVYTTDGDQLTGYLPEGYYLTKPELSIAYQQLRQVDWLYGSGYNLIWVAVPVRFNGQRDQVEGNYPLVVWENKTTPILTGRDMGIPKIYADIEDLQILSEIYRSRASYEGSTFLQMEMIRQDPLSEPQVKALRCDVNAVGWRYVPKLGGPGAEVSQPILYPMRSEPDCAWMGCGKIEWTELKPEQNPLQWPIIKALAALPIIEMAPVMMTKGRQFLMDVRGRVLK